MPGWGTTGDAEGPVAPSVYWATWTQVTTGAPGSATGTLSPPQGDVQVNYAGEVGSESEPTGVTTPSALGAITFAPASSFLSATVGNAPPPTGMIGVDGSAMLQQTITFSAPVQDPLLAVLSMGDGAIGSKMEFDFDATPTLLSSGGELVGSVALSGTLMASGQTLTGVEGTGVVQFTGTFTSIAFTIPMKEIGGSGTLTVGIRGR